LSQRCMPCGGNGTRATFLPLAGSPTGGQWSGRSVSHEDDCQSQIARNRHIRDMTNGEQRSDTELLVAARTCSEPFGVFYERHIASVLAFFRRRVPGPEEAFDLAAETFAAALASVPRFEP